MDPIYHWLIPLAVVLALGWDRKEALLLSVFTLLPDLDALVPGMHRYVLHNLFVCLLLPLAFTAYAAYRGNATWVRRGWLVTFYLISHIALDISGGVALL